jgi:hypothetical protein
MTERYLIVLFDKRSVIISKEQADSIKQALKEGATFVEVKDSLYKASAIAGIERQKSATQNAEQRKAEQLFLPETTKQNKEKIAELKKDFDKKFLPFPGLNSFERGRVEKEEKEIKQAISAREGCKEDGSWIDPETGETFYS